MSSTDNPRVFAPPPLIFAGALAFGLLIDRSPFELGGWLVVGVAVALAGLGLIGWALGLFRLSRTRPEPWQPASALVVTGVYRFTRNPMYLGMAMIAGGVALAFSSLPGTIMTLVAAVIIDRAVIPREEAYLVRRFGPEYQAYRRGVRRWL